ncbi:MAG: HypC/HybG/HupF family hydrogenase formation chaperone [Egibacteraceae bacterium]
MSAEASTGGPAPRAEPAPAGRGLGLAATEAVVVAGAGPACITCGDEAVEVTVLALEDGDLALVDTGAGTEHVSVMLVDALVGDRILVHAGEAIGKVQG